jgi:hypothetical protein
MGSHPLNLAIRFLLELSALTSVGIWGWRQGEGWLGFVFAIGIPIFLAAIWGTFAVPNDPSRSGKAPISIPGFFRLLIELGFFALAVLALYDLGYPRISLALGIITLLHYVVSYDRVLWLISHKE